MAIVICKADGLIKTTNLLSVINNVSFNSVNNVELINSVTLELIVKINQNYWAYGL